MKAPLLALCLLGFTACNNASINVAILAPSDGLDDVDNVIASVYAPGASLSVDCDSIAYGDDTLDELSATLSSQAQIFSRTSDNVLTPVPEAVLSVPRIGSKLVVVQAFTAGAVLVAAGCTQVDDVTRRTNVDVHLQYAARLSVDIDTEVSSGRRIEQGLRPIVSWGQNTEIDTPLLISINTSLGKSMPVGSLVRVRVVAPSGTYDPEQLLELDTLGQVRYAPMLHFVGPFRIDIAVAYDVENDAGIHIYGYAQADSFRQQVFAASDTVVQMYPGRVGQDQAGFFALIQRGSSYYLATASVERNGTELSFSIPSQVPFSSPLLHLGWVHTSAQGSMLVHQTIDAARPKIHFVSQNLEQGAPLQLERAGLASRALPIGPCDARMSTEADVNAAPLLIVPRQLIETPDDSSILLDLDGSQARFQCDLLTDYDPTASFCVADENNRIHRLLLLRPRERASNAKTESAFMDLGDGMTAVNNHQDVNCDAFPFQEVAGIAGIGTTVGEHNEPLLMLVEPTVLGAEVNILRVASEGNELLIYENTLLEPVSRSTATVHTANMTGAMRRDLLLITGTGINASSVAVFSGLYDDSILTGSYDTALCSIITETGTSVVSVQQMIHNHPQLLHTGSFDDGDVALVVYPNSNDGNNCNVVLDAIHFGEWPLAQ